MKLNATQIWSFTAAGLHLIGCLYVYATPSEGSWQWFPIYIVDFPASLVPLRVIPASVPPLISFGVVGTLWWYFIVRMVVGLVMSRHMRKNNA